MISGFLLSRLSLCQPPSTSTALLIVRQTTAVKETVTSLSTVQPVSRACQLSDAVGVPKRGERGPRDVPGWGLWK
ncbi:uncharacterized protein BDV14DRAFT_90014 [Aspergillus stella-maris]|uniref:uncharacterized protein n=1 Tax=Aspergillus stella-maris TaxID=1810926 RepID=UPI003CCCCC8F